jgi:iron complex transport system ATP-binding protein
MPELRAEGLVVERGGRPIVRDVSFAATPGELVVMVGPNGAGKSTLLRAAAGLEVPAAGTVRLGDASVHGMGPTERARHISYLPQARPLAWPVAVRDVVALGRFAYGAGGHFRSGEAHPAIDRALTDCGLTELAERRTDTLSGGELARVHLARAFAAEAPVLIVDEPAAGLDLRHQFALGSLLREEARRGRAVLAVMHELELAVRIADRIILLDEGRIVADGPPGTALSPPSLTRVFGIKAQLAGTADQPRLVVDGPSPARRD